MRINSLLFILSIAVSSYSQPFCCTEGETGVSLNPTMLWLVNGCPVIGLKYDSGWSGPMDTLHYLYNIQISLNSSFSNIVISDTVSSNL